MHAWIYKILGLIDSKVISLLTEIQTLDIKRVKFKMIGLLDINEFKEAAQESIESNYEFLGYGRLFQHIRPAEYLAFFLTC